MMISAAIMAFGALVGATCAWWLAGVASRQCPALRLRAATALAGAAVGAFSLRPGHYSTGPAWLCLTFGAALVALASCDLNERRIPNRLSYSVSIVAVVMCWAWPDRSIMATLIGIGVALGIIVAMTAVGMLVTGPSPSASGVGVGDMKLVVALGAILGWPLFGAALAIGITAGAIQALVTMALGQRTLAYGAALALGGVVALLWPTAPI